jgi:hypothetical protein
MMSENRFFFGKSALFDLDIETVIPDILDARDDEEKQYYVKVNCKTKEEVVRIIKYFEQLEIDKKRIVISA